MDNKKKKSNRVWTQSFIQEEKNRVRQELAQVEAKGGLELRLTYILDCIHSLESDLSARGQLKCYIYVMSGLVHFESFHGLKPVQVKHLEKVARAILKLNAIPATHSPLASLHHELDAVLSQIARRQGNHWRSAWLQQLATGCAPLEKNSPRELFGFALRYQRMGFVAQAVRALDRALRGDLPEALRGRAQLNRLIALRLMGNFSEWEAQVKSLRESSAALKIEGDWQSHCVWAQTTGDLSRLITSTLRGRSHFAAEYRIEAMLWARSRPEKQWAERLPSLKNVPHQMGHSKRDPIFKAASIIEDCYSTGLKTEAKLRRLGSMLEEAPSLMNLETELLVWTASARWLARMHYFPLSTLCLQQYETYSRRLTGGKNRDVLNLVSDLMAKPWYSNLVSSKEEADENPRTLPPHRKAA